MATTAAVQPYNVVDEEQQQLQEEAADLASPLSPGGAASTGSVGYNNGFNNYSYYSNTVGGGGGNISSSGGNNISYRYGSTNSLARLDRAYSSCSASSTGSGTTWTAAGAHGGIVGRKRPRRTWVKRAWTAHFAACVLMMLVGTWNRQWSWKYIPVNPESIAPHHLPAGAVAAAAAASATTNSKAGESASASATAICDKAFVNVMALPPPQLAIKAFSSSGNSGGGVEDVGTATTASEDALVCCNGSEAEDLFSAATTASAAAATNANTATGAKKKASIKAAALGICPTEVRSDLDF